MALERYGPRSKLHDDVLVRLPVMGRGTRQRASCVRFKFWWGRIGTPGVAAYYAAMRTVIVTKQKRDGSIRVEEIRTGAKAAKKLVRKLKRQCEVRIVKKARAAAPLEG
jgi:hypothetical protein